VGPALDPQRTWWGLGIVRPVAEYYPSRLTTPCEFRYAGSRPRRGDQMQFCQLKRRDFIRLMSGVMAVPLAVRARAQQANPMVGFLSSGSLNGYRSLLISFRKGLAELGYVEGRMLSSSIAGQRANTTGCRHLRLISFGVRRHYRIGSALAARAASATVPVVFLAGDDPVKFGLVMSLNRLGGSATGVAWLTSELFTKRVGLLRELLPAAGLIGVLINPKSPETVPQLKEVVNTDTMKPGYS
jgi:putative tryptophan/tyrosine transport system substrate-binding protein